MKKNYSAQKLIHRLDQKIRRRLDINETLILGVVLKGLPVGYGLARTNNAVDNFVPLVAQRHIYMQHDVESYFPSPAWREYFTRQLKRCNNLLIVDDVVNSGFTTQRVESVVHSLNTGKESNYVLAALVLNRRILANRRFVRAHDVFAMKVNAEDVECDWGQITVPLWDLSVEEARRRCEEYFQTFWVNEKRSVTITY